MGLPGVLDGDLTVIHWSLRIATLGYAQSLEAVPGSIGKRIVGVD
jgi:hypothetical protein